MSIRRWRSILTRSRGGCGRRWTHTQRPLDAPRYAPGELLAERYRARLDQRLSGHPGAAYIPELIELAKRAEPLRRGPLFEVDTTKSIDFDAITGWLRAVIEG